MTSRDSRASTAMAGGRVSHFMIEDPHDMSFVEMDSNDRIFLFC